jgi:hypothetical protein
MDIGGLTMRTCHICGSPMPTSEDVLWHSIIHMYDKVGNYATGL